MGTASVDFGLRDGLVITRVGSRSSTVDAMAVTMAAKAVRPSAHSAGQTGESAGCAAGYDLLKPSSAFARRCLALAGLAGLRLRSELRVAKVADEIVDEALITR